MGSVVSVMVALLLLLQALDNPFNSGVGGLKPVAMERSLRMVDEALGAVGAKVTVPVRRGRKAGADLSAHRREARPRRAAGDGAPLARDGGDRVERLPGDPLERRAGEGGSPRERRADRVGQGVGPGEHADGDRRRHVHAVGERLRPAPDRSFGTSTSGASARSSSPRSPPGSRPSRSRTRRPL